MADGALLQLLLENVGSEPLEVMSHVAAGEIHLDWFTVHVNGRRIAFLDARDRSAPVRARLAPGEWLGHAVDVAAWAARRVNGGEPLAPGDHRARATYEVAPREDAWNGRLEAGPVVLRIGGDR